MKLTKLNARGFSHEIVLVMLVVIVGIGGSAYLVLSHADSCTPASSPMSSPTSSPASPVSCPVSDPTSVPVPVSTVSKAGSCGINLGVSTAPKFGKVVKPTFTEYNTGTAAFGASVKLAFISHALNSKPITLSQIGMANPIINPGGSQKVVSPITYKVGLATARMSSVTFSVTNTTAPTFTCSASIKLPHTNT